VRLARVGLSSCGWFPKALRLRCRNDNSCSKLVLKQKTAVLWRRSFFVIARTRPSDLIASILMLSAVFFAGSAPLCEVFDGRVFSRKRRKVAKLRKVQTQTLPHTEWSFDPVAIAPRSV